MKKTHIIILFISGLLLFIILCGSVLVVSANQIDQKIKKYKYDLWVRDDSAGRHSLIRVKGRKGEKTDYCPEADKWYIAIPEINIYSYENNSIVEVEEQTKTRYQWNEEDPVLIHNSSIHLSDDLIMEGMHRLKVWAEDASGSVIYYEEENIWIDTLKPEFTNICFSSNGQLLSSRYSEWEFVRDDAEVHFDVYDTPSGLAGVIMKSASQEVFVEKNNMEEVIVDDQQVLRGKLSLAEIQDDFSGVLSIAAVSNSSLCSAEYRSKNIITDSTAPCINYISLEGSLNQETGWYYSDVKGYVLVEDTESGLQSVTIKVNGYAGTDEGGESIELGYTYDKINNEQYQSVPERSEREFYFPIAVQDYLANSEGRYIIEVICEDNAGNIEVMEPVEIWIDTAVPVISVQADTIYKAVGGIGKEPYIEAGEETRWSANKVEFTLGNVNEHSVSPINYYVKQLDGEWELIGECSAKERMVYTIDTEPESILNGKYMFKAVASNGEYEKYFEEALHISDMKNVKIDKQKPAKPVISITSTEATAETDTKDGWHRIHPDVRIDQNQDAGSPILTEICLYNEDKICIDRWIYNPDDYAGNNYWIKLTREGTFFIQAVTTDEVMWNEESDLQMIKIDTEKPTPIDFSIELLEESTIGRVLAGYIPTFIYNKTVSIRMQSSDITSGIETYYYKAVPEGQKFSDITFGQGDTCIISSGFKGDFYAYVSDTAGNTTYISAQYENGKLLKIVTDNIAPELSIRSTADSKQWQNRNIIFEIDVIDNLSGVDYIVYELYGQRKTIIPQKQGGEPHTESYNFSIKADKETISKSEDILTVNVVDYAGNINKISQSIKIDKTPPKISIEGVANSEHYDEDRALKIFIDEYNYEETAINISIMKNGEVLPNSGMLEKISWKDGMGTAELKFIQEGAYSVVVDAVDGAGNKAVRQSISFEIDKTSPEVEIKDLEQNKFYNHNVSITIQVKEKNFITNSIYLSIERNQGDIAEKIKILPWKMKSENDILQFTLIKDGLYTVRVYAEDKAGNISNREMSVFTIDQTPPALGISGIENNEITSKPFRLDFASYEINYSEKLPAYSLEWEDVKGFIHQATLAPWERKSSLSAAHVFVNRDGIYSAYLSEKDIAGNEKSVEKTFILDTTDPVIRYVDELDGQYLQVFRLERPIEDMVQDLTLKMYHAYVDSMPFYYKNEIVEEGKHIFRIEVTDEAGLSAESSAVFIIDRTPPDIQIEGIDDGKKTNRE